MNEAGPPRVYAKPLPLAWGWAAAKRTIMDPAGKMLIGAIGSVPVGLLLVACLATERDRGQALADGIRYVQVGCAEYLRDARIPLAPRPDRTGRRRGRPL